MTAIFDENFLEFERKKIAKFIKPLYDSVFKKTKKKKILPLIKPQLIKNSLGEVLSQNKLNQLRITETEKYAHITYFFNGGIEDCFPEEDRILIPSPRVETYDEKT